MRKHFICTRNSYPVGYLDLSRRVALLRHITIPGLRAQTNQAFTWLLNGSQGLEEADFQGLDVQFSGDFRMHIKEILAKEPEVTHVITTRLDNDDHLLPGFVDTVQRRALGEDRLLIDAQGYRYDMHSGMLFEDRLYGPTFPSPFLSVLEETNGPNIPKFAFVDFHKNMHRHFPVAQLKARLWVQTLHGSNQRNDSDDLKNSRSHAIGLLTAKAASDEDFRPLANGCERVMRNSGGST